MTCMPTLHLYKCLLNIVWTFRSSRWSFSPTDTLVLNLSDCLTISLLTLPHVSVHGPVPGCTHASLLSSWLTVRGLFSPRICLCRTSFIQLFTFSHPQIIRHLEQWYSAFRRQCSATEASGPNCEKFYDSFKCLSVANIKHLQHNTLYVSKIAP